MTPVQCANVPPLFGEIIGRRLASLHDLETVYSYSDALNLWEISLVGRYNDVLTQRRE